MNVIAPIFTSPQGLFLQTIYHPLRLYAEHRREIALDVHVSGETYDLPPAQETEEPGRVHRVSDLGPVHAPRRLGDLRTPPAGRSRWPS